MLSQLHNLQSTTHFADAISNLDMKQEIILPITWYDYVHRVEQDYFILGINTDIVEDTGQDVDLIMKSHVTTTLSYDEWRLALLQANYYMVKNNPTLNPCQKHTASVQNNYNMSRSAWLALIDQAPSEWLYNSLIDSPPDSRRQSSEETTVWSLSFTGVPFIGMKSGKKVTLRLPTRMSSEEIARGGYECGGYKLAFEPERVTQLDTYYGQAWKLWLIDKTHHGWLVEGMMWLIPVVMVMYQKMTPRTL